jgi:hypothetical protein
MPRVLLMLLWKLAQMKPMCRNETLLDRLLVLVLLWMMIALLT